MRKVAKRLLQFSSIRFVMLTGSSFLLNVGTTVFLSEVVRLPSEVSFLIALVIVFVANFLCLRYWVYGGGEQVLGFWNQLGSFLASSLSFRAAEYTAFLVFHTLFRLNYLLVLLTVLVASSVAKYY